MMKHADLIEIMMEQRAAMVRGIYQSGPIARRRRPETDLVTRRDAEPDPRPLHEIASEARAKMVARQKKEHER